MEKIPIDSLVPPHEHDQQDARLACGGSYNFEDWHSLYTAENVCPAVIDQAWIFRDHLAWRLAELSLATANPEAAAVGLQEAQNELQKTPHGFKSSLNNDMLRASMPLLRARLGNKFADKPYTSKAVHKSYLAFSVLSHQIGRGIGDHTALTPPTDAEHTRRNKLLAAYWPTVTAALINRQADPELFAVAASPRESSHDKVAYGGRFSHTVSDISPGGKIGINTVPRHSQKQKRSAHIVSVDSELQARIVFAFGGGRNAARAHPHASLQRLGYTLKQEAISATSPRSKRALNDLSTWLVQKVTSGTLIAQ
jgi:hypothetical protein